MSLEVILIRLGVFAIIVGLTFIIDRIFSFSLRKLHLRMPSHLVKQLDHVGSWAIWLIGLVVAFSQLGFDVTILVVITAIIGVAFIIGVRDILADFASGQLIAAYQPFKVGEWVHIGDHYGHVIEINPANTVLATPDNEFVVIPNSVVRRQTIVNHTRLGELRIRVPVTVSRDSDLAIVEKALLNVAKHLKTDLSASAVPEVRIASIKSKDVTLELLVSIPHPGKKEVIQSMIHRMIADALKGARKTRPQT